MNTDVAGCFAYASSADLRTTLVCVLYSLLFSVLTYVSSYLLPISIEYVLGRRILISFPSLLPCVRCGRVWPSSRPRCR